MEQSLIDQSLIEQSLGSRVWGAESGEQTTYLQSRDVLAPVDVQVMITCRQKQLLMVGCDGSKPRSSCSSGQLSIWAGAEHHTVPPAGLDPGPCLLQEGDLVQASDQTTFSTSVIQLCSGVHGWCCGQGLPWQPRLVSSSTVGWNHPDPQIPWNQFPTGLSWDSDHSRPVAPRGALVLKMLQPVTKLVRGLEPVKSNLYGSGSEHKPVPICRLTSFCFFHLVVIGQKRGGAKEELSQSVHCPKTHTHTHTHSEQVFSGLAAGLGVGRHLLLWRPGAVFLLGGPGAHRP